MTQNCLDTLLQLDYTGHIRFIVCDNASGNQSLFHLGNWARRHFAPAHLHYVTPFTDLDQACKVNAVQRDCVLLQTGANLGYAGGNNAGIRYALQGDYEFIWLLNNDTVVDTAALQHLIQHAQQHPRQAMLGSTLVNAAQRQQVECAGGCRYNPWTTVMQRVWGDAPLNEVLNTTQAPHLDYVAGAAMLLRTAALREVGLLYEGYFLFYEELDYAQRLRQHGWELGWCRDSVVYHQGGATIGQTDKQQQIKRYRASYYENRSTLLYTRRFHPHLLAFVLPFRFCAKLVLLSLRGDFNLIGSVLRAYVDFLRGR